jgi:septal ring factor EnvC (AmiA/AmiB activator)
MVKKHGVVMMQLFIKLAQDSWINTDIRLKAVIAAICMAIPFIREVPFVKVFVAAIVVWEIIPSAWGSLYGKLKVHMGTTKEIEELEQTDRDNNTRIGELKTQYNQQSTQNKSITDALKTEATNLEQQKNAQIEALKVEEVTLKQQLLGSRNRTIMS